MQFGGRYGFGLVSVRIRCICETALSAKGLTVKYVQHLFSTQKLAHKWS